MPKTEYDIKACMKSSCAWNKLVVCWLGHLVIATAFLTKWGGCSYIVSGDKIDIMADSVIFVTSFRLVCTILPTAHEPVPNSLG